ncbi:MAG TPA: dihydrofolate reductase family protein [Candidatus Polarisedimenticolaceae bacterium]|nr:dihydrofolate reductase family protein [Candidatus Polarisedimenticolaceae bacterium]
MASPAVARPRTSVFVGTSLDGFLARRDGTFDFLTAGGDGDGAANGFDAFLASVDAVLMGRNTYEVVRPFPVWPYGSKPVFVLTRRALPPSRNDAVVEPLAGPPAQVLEALAARGLGHVYVDGGLTIQQFLRAGLVDRIVVTRVPVLIGEGIPLFGAVEADVLLRHTGTRVLPGGAVQSEYAVQTSGILREP